MKAHVKAERVRKSYQFESATSEGFDAYLAKHGFNGGRLIELFMESTVKNQKHPTE